MTRVQVLHLITLVKWYALLAVLIAFLVSIKIYVPNVKTIITFYLKTINVMPYVLMGTGKTMF